MTVRHFDGSVVEARSGQFKWPHHNVDYLFYGMGDSRGGDHFVLEESDGCLTFAVADAAGHGPKAALFWDHFTNHFNDCWNQFLVGFESIEERLKNFAASFDEQLYTQSVPELISNHLSIALGEWTADGQLCWANFGYGAHVLPHTDNGSWWANAETLFGLKLGWLSPSMRFRMPRATVINRVESVSRVILMTDAFLGDDYENPAQTMTELGQLNEKLATLPFDQINKAVRESSAEPSDDVTLIAIEKRAPGQL
jgi:hypothetical protein